MVVAITGNERTHPGGIDFSIGQFGFLYIRFIQTWQWRDSDLMLIALFKIFSFVSSWKFILIGGFLMGSCSIWSWKRKIYKRGYDAGFNGCISKVEASSKKQVKKRLKNYDRQKKRDNKEIDKIKKNGDIEKILD